MSNVSYIRILNALGAFASEHLQIKKFASDFPGQLPNFANRDEEYPILYVSPSTSIFNTNAKSFDLNIYCFDLIQADRENINTILSDTNSILNDLVLWLQHSDVDGIDLIDSSTAIPLNNSLLDYAAGWQMTITLEVNSYTICEIPFLNFPSITGCSTSITFPTFLTCDTLENCSIIQDIQSDIFELSGRTDVYVTGGTFSSTAQTATFTNNTGGTFSVSGFSSGIDIYVTGGTFSSSAATATFTNNTGGTFNVTGFTTTSTGGSFSVTGTTNFLQKVDAFSGLTDSNIFDNGSLVSISANTNIFGNLTGNSMTVNNDLFLNGITLFTGTARNIGVDINNKVVELPIDETLTVLATNKTGVSIPKGSVVYITGGQGARPTIALALADTAVTTSLAVGITLETIANNGTGIVVTDGIASGLNTSAFVDGDRLYLSPFSGGGLTTTIPTSPNQVTFIGTVVNAHAVQGIILVNILYTFKVDRLTDVAISAITNNDVLAYESSTQLWKNKSLTSIGGVTTATTLNINGNVYDLSTNREWLVAQGATGVLTFGTGLTFNSTTTIDIAPITGYIVDNETNPAIPTFTYVSYSGATGLTVTTLGTGQSSYVLLDNSGITFQNTFPTSTERKVKMWLGKIGHPQNLITVVANEPDFITSPLAQHRDLFQAFNYINNGVYAQANGVNLTFNTTGGNVIGNGINLHNSKTNPNELFIMAQIPANFVYRTQTGGTGTTITAIDPNSIDIGGVITPIVSGASMQYIFLVPNGGYVVQYGQNQYNTLLGAIAMVGRESFVLFPNLDKNALLVSVIAVAFGATDLSDTTQAQFFKADKLGQIIGAAGGTSTTNLQGAYNNSVSPQIVTNNVLGALTIQGFADDTNIVFQTQNTGATSTFLVNNAGSLSATTIVKSGGTGNQFLLADGAITEIIDGGLF